MLLVADIGGTNARFAVADPGTADLLERRDYASAAAASGTELVARAAHDLNCTPTACVVALAGPVLAGSGRLSNGHLAFTADSLRAVLNCPAAVINDFVALARSAPHLAAVTLVGPELLPPADCVKAMVGPGTGLGMGFVVPHNGGWLVQASEGGNADFAPHDALEQELLAVLQGQFGSVSWERLLSGPGLVNLYRGLCEIWGSTPSHTTPAAIVAAGLELTEPLCHQCLEMFCGMLGSAAGNFALAVYARGGVYIAGGIVPRFGDFFAQSPFRRRFEERGAMSELLRATPTYLVQDPDAGLRGAAFQARDFLGAAPSGVRTA